MFEAGTVSKFIKVSVVGDRTNEANEAFKINLFSPFGLVLGTATGTVTTNGDSSRRLIRCAECGKSYSRDGTALVLAVA